MKLVICKICKKEKEHQAKGLCFNCYRKYSWKQKLIVCKRCGRQKPNHAKGFCSGCYQFVFRLDANKSWNQMNNYNLDIATYRKITSQCVLCGFSKVVDLHYLDENKKNNSENNLIGLCPNHHKMLHDFRYKKEILNQLKEKGFHVKEDPKLDFS